MLPALYGKPVRVVIRATLGPHWAATSIPRRVIYLDREVLAQRGEFERILVHELFHFVWVRLSNQVRDEWRAMLAVEFKAHARGELGWSAERRKAGMRAATGTSWKRYCCESFCDTAAWLYAGLSGHDEFSLAPKWSGRRAAWLKNLATNGLWL